LASTNGDIPATRSRGYYKVRRVGNDAYAIGLPREVGEELYGRVFAIEINDQGILFTPMGESDATNLADTLKETSWA